MKKYPAKFLSFLKLRFMNSNLTKKLIVIYVLAFFIPITLLSITFYQNNLKKIEETYYENQHNILLSSKESLSTQLNQISAAYNFFQQSESLQLILNGTYSDVSNTLFYYIRDINPLITAATVDPYITNVHIYGFQNYALNMENGLASTTKLEKDEAFFDTVRHNRDLWEFTASSSVPSLQYYKGLFSSSYPYYIGILSFDIDLEGLSQNFYQIIMRPFFFQLQDGSLIGYDNGTFIDYNKDLSMLSDSCDHIYTLQFTNGMPQILVPISPPISTQHQFGQIMSSIITMIFVFSIFYLLLSLSVTNRLRSFAEHIQNTNALQLKPYESNSYTDEVGIVFHAYNEMVLRINNLINEVLTVRLQKQDAEYYALQAQIKPHFLYNILENIRMNAEINHDPSTADMLQSLGQHMRYNLNRSSHPILLEEELRHARDFFQIHKIRMHNKIALEISISTEIDDVYSPRLLIQPLLENALQHGYILGSQLKIKISVTEAQDPLWSNFVMICIRDNGNGISSDTLSDLNNKLNYNEIEENNHVGLLNVNNRLATFSSHDTPCLFIDSSVHQGTAITFYLRHDKGAQYENITG